MGFVALVEDEFDDISEVIINERVSNFIDADGGLTP